MQWSAALGIVCLLAVFDVAISATGKNGTAEEDTNSIEYILQHPEHPRFHPVAWNDTDYKLIKGTEDMIKKLMPMIVRQSSEINLSGPCMAALFKMILAIRKQRTWAYKRMYNILCFIFIQSDKDCKKN